MHLGNMKSVNYELKKDLLSYKYSELQFGKDLYGDASEAALNAVFDDNSTDIAVQKLAPATHLQGKEAFNNVVGLKKFQNQVLQWK